MTRFDWAAWSARHLGPVFPLHTIKDGQCTCRHTKCDSPGKHPLTTRGLRDATYELERIEQWWDEWPTANIGIATGHKSDALDIDGRAGEEAFDRWWATNVPNYSPNLNRMIIVGTGGDGQHWFGKPTDAGNRVRFLESCDWRGKGGYVVGPGSVHISGKSYELLNTTTDCQLIDWPDELVQLVARTNDHTSTKPIGAPRFLTGGDCTRYGEVALRSACSTIASTPQGSRNAVLFYQAAKIFELVAGEQINELLAVSWLTQAGLACGLGERAVCATLKSAGKHGLKSPRRPERVA